VSEKSKPVLSRLSGSKHIDAAVFVGLVSLCLAAGYCWLVMSGATDVALTQYKDLGVNIVISLSAIVTGSTARHLGEGWSKPRSVDSSP
jgi:uncharacterized MnhB-related membrane protein